MSTPDQYQHGGPAMGMAPPPPGVTPNLDHPPQDRTPFVLTTVFLIIALLFVCMRLFTRIVLVRAFGGDDVTCVIAMLFGIAFAITNYELIHYGLGIELYNIRVGAFNVIAWSRWTYVQDLIYSLVMGFIKISILLLYFRLFNVKGVTRWLIYSTITFIALYTLVGDLITIFACHPLNKLWDGVPGGYCLSPAAVGLALSALQIVSDVFILAIPVPIIMNLQLPLKQRVGIMSLFGAGVFVTIASSVRLSCLVNALNDPGAILHPTTSILPFDNWTVVEVYLAIIISCISTAKPFVLRISPWIRSIFFKGSQYSGSGSNQSQTRVLGHPASSRRLMKRSGPSFDFEDDDTIVMTNSIKIEMEHVEHDERSNPNLPRISYHPGQFEDAWNKALGPDMEGHNAV